MCSVIVDFFFSRVNPLLLMHEKIHQAVKSYARQYCGKVFHNLSIAFHGHELLYVSVFRFIIDLLGSLSRVSEKILPSFLNPRGRGL